MGRANWKALKEEGVVPEHYYAQCQYQMFATGIKEMLLLAMTDEKLARENIPNKFFSGIAMTKVLFDDVFAREMILKCNEFYKCMVERTMPELVDLDYKKVKDALLEVHIDDYLVFKEELALRLSNPEYDAKETEKDLEAIVNSIRTRMEFHGSTQLRFKNVLVRDCLSGIVVAVKSE